MTTIARSGRIERVAKAGFGPLSRFFHWLFVRRHRTVAVERLSDHLLRDIGACRRHRFPRDQHR